MKRFFLAAALALVPMTAIADHGHGYRYRPRPSVIAPHPPVRYSIVYQGNDGQRLTIIVLDRFTGELNRREFRVNAFDQPERPRRQHYNPGRTGNQVNRDIQRGR